MKKIFALILALVFVMAFTLTASATDEALDSTNSTPETESVTEAEISPSVTETIVAYFQSNLEEIAVIGSLIVGMFYEIRKHGKLTGSIGTLNNNAITIAKDAAAKMTEVAGKLESYETNITTKLEEFEKKYGDLLGAFEADEEERLSFADTLAKLEKLMAAVKLAATENSDEIANLILLSGIPNAKKDELYGKHLLVVKALEAIEEGETNDGEKA